MEVVCALQLPESLPVPLASCLDQPLKGCSVVVDHCTLCPTHHHIGNGANVMRSHLPPVHARRPATKVGRFRFPGRKLLDFWRFPPEECRPLPRIEIAKLRSQGVGCVESSAVALLPHLLRTRHHKKMASLHVRRSKKDGKNPANGLLGR
jgi:hypothetical protein